MEELINGLVYYKIFDKTFKDSSHRYIKKDNTLGETEIAKNKEAIINYLKATDILILRQTHGNQIVEANSSIIPEPEVDGSITTKKGLVLAIQTADCVPVLLASGDGRVIGAAHVGWRGSIADIIDNIVTKMQEKGATNLIAVIGPCIAQNSYEVDEEYYQAFLSKDINSQQFFIKSKKKNHYMFDLPGFIELKLKELGIENIKNITENTYINPAKYPSKRRTYHLRQPYNENILSTIVIK